MGHLNYARIEDLYPATFILQYTKLFSVWNTYEVKIGGVVWAIPLKGSLLISSYRSVKFTLKQMFPITFDGTVFKTWTCLSCSSWLGLSNKLEGGATQRLT